MLSALSLPGVSMMMPVASALNSNSTEIVAVTENSCVDTRAFAECLPVSVIESDPAAILQQLARGFEEGEFQIAYGLTRGSNMMLIEQYAQQFRYSLVYHAVHQYHEPGLLHEISAPPGVCSSLRKTILAEPANWVSSVSRVPLYISQRGSRPVTENIQTELEMPASSPGQLVSWMFYRETA